MSFGISKDDAEAEITRELEEDFLNKGDRYHTVFVSLLTWSFGVVEKQVRCLWIYTPSL